MFVLLTQHQIMQDLVFLITLLPMSGTIQTREQYVIPTTMPVQLEELAHYVILPSIELSETHYPQELELLQEAMDLRLATAIMLLDSMKTIIILRLVLSLPVRVLDKIQVTLVGLMYSELRILGVLKTLQVLFRLISTVLVALEQNL